MQDKGAQKNISEAVFGEYNSNCSKDFCKNADKIYFDGFNKTLPFLSSTSYKDIKPLYSDRSKVHSLNSNDSLSINQCYNLNSDLNDSKTITTKSSFSINEVKKEDKPKLKKSSIKAYLKVSWSKQFYQDRKKSTKPFLSTSFIDSSAETSSIPNLNRPCPIHSNKSDFFNF